MERIVSLLYRNSTRIELATGCRRRCAIRYLISAKFSLIGLGLERAFFPEVIPHLFLYRGPIEIYNLSRSTFLITLLLEWLPNDEWLWCNKSGIRTQLFGQCRICPLDPNIFTGDDFVTGSLTFHWSLARAQIFPICQLSCPVQRRDPLSVQLLISLEMWVPISVCLTYPLQQQAFFGI